MSVSKSGTAGRIQPRLLRPFLHCISPVLASIETHPLLPELVVSATSEEYIADHRRARPLLDDVRNSILSIPTSQVWLMPSCLSPFLDAVIPGSIIPMRKKDAIDAKLNFHTMTFTDFTVVDLSH